MERSDVRFENVSPILRVENLEVAKDYYVSCLGFEIEWEYGSTIACVSRNQCSLFLCQGDQGHSGAWVWIGVSDAQAIFEEFESAGAVIRLKPTNYSWALETHVEDVDGNILRFGSSPTENQPFGDWIDMYGRTWSSEQDES